jgi:hypothetical protein
MAAGSQSGSRIESGQSVWTERVVMRLKIKRLSLKVAAAMAVSLCGGNVFADTIQNGGFETGNFTDWTLGGGFYDSTGAYTASTGAYDKNGKYSGLGNVGSDLERSAVVPYEPETLRYPGFYSTEATDFKTEHPVGPTGGVDGSRYNLNRVFSGSKSLRLNDWRDGSHYSTISQTVNNWSGDKLYFAWAAVLEEPNENNLGVDGHSEIDSHFSYKIEVVDINGLPISTIDPISKSFTYDTLKKLGLAKTGETDSYTDATGSYVDTWFYTDWQVTGIDTSAFKNQNIKITFLASDCGWEGHGGYAYLDSIGTVNPVPEPSTWLAGCAALGMLGVFGWRSRKQE